jgi:Xaa-Pro dipeptidase
VREVDVKVERLARLARAEGVGGILVNTQPNFAWLTGGRSNRVDGSRENGAGSLLVSARGDRFVIANNIEMPRLQDEALAGLGFAPCEYSWTAEHADPTHPIATARRALDGAEVACDGAMAGGRPIESLVAAARALLTDEEVTRYRALGCDMGRALAQVCRELTPGLEEREIASRMAAAVMCAQARPIVTLVAADDRIDRYRHPVATELKWQTRVLLVLCAQRDGLIASLSRMVVAGKPSDELTRRTVATTRVFERLLQATRPGATGAQLYAAAALAYDEAGYPAEETRHHQGGATGYRSREWIAHPASREIVQRQQAFAWNPSIGGTKVEDTALTVDGRTELISASPDWPTIPMTVHGHLQHAAAPLSV